MTSLPKKLLVGLAAAVGAVVILVVVLVLLVNSGVATKRAVELVLPSVSKALGREVTLRGAELKLFPNPRVNLGGLAVAGRAGEPALVEAESLDVEVGLWPLLRSLGKDVEVHAFTLVKPNLNLVRAKDGTWNYEGLGAASGPASAPPPEAQRPAEGGTSVAVQVVRIEDAAVRVIDRTLGKDDPGLALEHLDLEARGVGPGLPFDAQLAAAFASESQNVHAQLSVERLPSGVPQAPADWPSVKGSVKLGALALDRIRSLLPGELGAILRGGTASLDARLTTAGGPSYQVDGTGKLEDVRLRGKPAAGSFRAAAAWSPAKPDAAKIDVSDLALKGPGVDLGGRLSVDTAPLRAWFALSGPLLDLDAVMGVLPDAPAQAQASTPPQGELVPEATRKQIQGAAARGTIAIGKLKGGRLEATEVKARAVLSKGTLVLEELDAAVFGGRVSAAGTQVSLAEKEPTWKLAAKLSQLDLAQATTAFAGKAPLVARVDGTLELAGAGTEWEKLRDAVTGLAALALKDGTLTTTDLGDEVLGAVAKGLEVAGRGGLAKRLTGARGGKTTFKDLAGKFTVKDGFLAASSPFELATPTGKIRLGGRIGLDGRLDLQGSVAVPRKVLAEVVSGVPLPETLDVPLGLGGDLGAPRVSVRADEAAKGILRGQAQEAEKAAREGAERAARKGVEGLLDRLGKKPR